MGKRSSCGVSDACEYLLIDGSVGAEISIKGLDTSRLVTMLEKWETQGASTNSSSGFPDDADQSESGASDIESGLTTIHLQPS